MGSEKKLQHDAPDGETSLTAYAQHEAAELYEGSRALSQVSKSYLNIYI